MAPIKKRENTTIKLREHAQKAVFAVALCRCSPLALAYGGAYYHDNLRRNLGASIAFRQKADACRALGALIASEPAALAHRYVGPVHD